MKSRNSIAAACGGLMLCSSALLGASPSQAAPAHRILATADISPSSQTVNAGALVTWNLTWSGAHHADLLTGDGSHLGPWYASSATNFPVNHVFCPQQTTNYTQTLKVRDVFGDVLAIDTSTVHVIGNRLCRGSSPPALEVEFVVPRGGGTGLR